MKTNRKPIRRLLDRAQKTFVRSRPGSVLILVIALLVLMALIGTAYMSMAQVDRATSIQHANNNEIELLMDGLANVARGVISGDTFNQGNYRPGAQYNVALATNYNHYNGVGLDQLSISSTTGLPGSLVTMNPGNPYLAQRAPELTSELSAGNGLVSASNFPMWSHITAPLIGGNFSSPIAYQFPTGFLLGQPPTPQGTFIYSQRSSRYGTFWTQPLYPSVYPGTSLPAWVDNVAAPTRAFLAADADGDGIADAGLIKLPMGSINNLTYYAAFRIIDNNSAVNVNTAWEHNPLTNVSTGPALPGDFFPSSIDLKNFVAGTDGGPVGNNQFPLAQYHFGAVPYSATAVSPIDGTLQVFDETGIQRGDYLTYNSLLEAQWTQLGRRVNNPGAVSSTNRFVAVPLSDGLNLTHRFIVRDGTAQFSTIEQLLPFSLANAFDATLPIVTSPYAPGDVGNWYNSNFAFMSRELNQPTLGQMQPFVPLRGMLTSYNPVSNFAPNKFLDRGNFDQSLTYSFGDTVISGGHRFICINPVNTGATGVAPSLSPIYIPALAPAPTQAQAQSWAYDNDTWALLPWTDAPTKISVNTGTFGQLYSAYWAAMAEQSNATGTLLTTAPFNNQPTGVGSTSRMFRSPLRLPPTTPSANAPYPPTGGPIVMGLTSLQTMQLRAAIAAVNTIDMRDNDDDVTSRTVTLVDLNNPVIALRAVTATVYGSEPQPFMTEVYATNKQATVGAATAQGYIALKLYNPYNFPLTLEGYTFGAINRVTQTITAPVTPATVPPTLSIVPITTGWTGGNAPVIPPYGFIVVTSVAGTSYGDGGGSVTLPQGTMGAVKPAGLGVGVYPNIAQYVVDGLIPGALNSELVLLRPRRTVGLSRSQSTVTILPHEVEGQFDETLNVSDMVPVDSYDLTGLDQITNPASEGAMEWHYLRPSSSENSVAAFAANDLYSSWHCVYPGHYLIASAGVSPVGTPTPPMPDTIDTTSLSGFPRFIDGTYRGTFPGGSFVPNPVGLPQPNTVLVPPAFLAPAPQAGELWTLAQYFSGASSATGLSMYANPKMPYVDIPLRMNAADSAGPNNPMRTSRVSGAAEPLGHPFGGFARNGDILQVPYIGAYKLSVFGAATNSFLELNSVSMDSVMALAAAQPAWNETTPAASETVGTYSENGGKYGDPLIVPVTPPVGMPFQVLENVGRFCPVNTTLGLSNSAIAINDYAQTEGAAVWRYHFATRLLDYLTVQSPQQDTTLDVDPAASDPVMPANSQLYKYPKTSVSTNMLPFPIANSLPNVFNNEASNPLNATEQTGGVQGLVNINTAPWRVLATVPWLPPDPARLITDNAPRLANAAIGFSIAYYRDIDGGGGVPHGPFKNLFELNNVPILHPAIFSSVLIPANTLFKDIPNVAPYSTTPYFAGTIGNLQAAYAPGHVDPTQGDFQSQFLMINRASNLVTTRSDTFTVYILLQGWQYAETNNAVKKVERRATYLVDRTSVVGSTKALPTMTFIPSN